MAARRRPTVPFVKMAFYVTRTDRKKLKRLVKKQGMSLSGWLRVKIRGEVEDREKAFCDE